MHFHFGPNQSFSGLLNVWKDYVAFRIFRTDLIALSSSSLNCSELTYQTKRIPIQKNIFQPNEKISHTFSKTQPLKQKNPPLCLLQRTDLLTKEIFLILPRKKKKFLIISLKTTMLSSEKKTNFPIVNNFFSLPEKQRISYNFAKKLTSFVLDVFLSFYM